MDNHEEIQYEQGMQGISGMQSLDIMNKYEGKRQARIDSLNSAADRAEKRAPDTYDSARKMSEVIPVG